MGLTTLLNWHQRDGQMASKEQLHHSQRHTYQGDETPTFITVCYPIMSWPQVHCTLKTNFQGFTHQTDSTFQATFKPIVPWKLVLLPSTVVLSTVALKLIVPLNHKYMCIFQHDKLTTCMPSTCSVCTILSVNCSLLLLVEQLKKINLQTICMLEQPFYPFVFLWLSYELFLCSPFFCAQVGSAVTWPNY